MRSKLEPGCMAITVGCFIDENNGKIVTCLRYVGKMEGSWDDDLWETDTILKNLLVHKDNTDPEPSDSDPFCPSRNLQRIDDNETKCLNKPVHITEPT